MERRLAAILAADVVGYSRLMEADEMATLAALHGLQDELIDPKIADRRGRVVKLLGDGLLAEFPSAVEAVQCAVEIQRALTDRNADVPQDRRIAYRIGINIGDIIVKDADIFGEGVNVAARLEGLAEPGGICVSRTVVNHVKGRVELEFEDLGEQRVKNISTPIGVFRVVFAATPREAMGGCESRSCAARQGIDRGSALRQHERRRGARLLCRRHGRGDHYSLVALPLVLRHRPQLQLHLQGAGR